MKARPPFLLLALASSLIPTALYAQANLQLLATTGVVDRSQNPASQDINTNQSVLGAALSFPVTVSLTNTFGQGSGSAAATGQAGFLRCQSTAGYAYVDDASNQGGYSSTEARSTFVDFLTVNSATLPRDTVVLFSFTYTIHGTASGPPKGQTGGRASEDIFGSLLAESSIDSKYKSLSFAAGTLGEVQGQVQAKVGETFRIVYILDAITYLSSDVQDYRLLTSDGASPGFGATISISPQDPTNVSFTAASGYTYGSTPPAAGTNGPAPVVTETDAELAAALDADGDGQLDYLVIDKATGLRQLGLQQTDGSFTWSDPLSTGVDQVTGLGIGQFGGPADGFAVASPLWNRVALFTDPTGDPSVVPSVGIGPALVVGLNFGGDAHDDLAVGTIWDKGDVFTHLSGLLDSAGGFSLGFGPQEETGALSRGNRVHLLAGGSALVGALRDSNNTNNPTKDFVLRSLTSGASGGPTLPELPSDTGWAWGLFQTNDLPRFLFYQPGNSNLFVPLLQGSPPGPFSWSPGTNYSFALPISGIVVVPNGSSALLFVVFDDGNSAGLFNFDGNTRPVLRQSLTASNGLKFSTAGALANGDFLVLAGPDGPHGTSTSWQRWANQGTHHQLVAGGNLPPIDASQARANVLLFDGNPDLNPAASLLRLLRVGQWSDTAAQAGAKLHVTDEEFLGPATGLGSLQSADVSVSLSAYFPAVNQRAVLDSVAVFTPPAPIAALDVFFSPAPGTYQLKNGNPLSVLISSTSTNPIQYRVGPTRPWSLYDPFNPPQIAASATLQAFVDAPAPGPIRSGSYVIANAPPVAVGGVVDANHNGLPDAWEQAFGVNDPQADPDGDGATNLQEYLAGTDPLDPLSKPGGNSSEVELTVRPPGSEAPPGTLCEIAWPLSLTGVVLESADHLGDATAWTPVGGPEVVVGSELVYYEMKSAQSARYFRLRIQP